MKLEAGKTYQRRDGEVETITELSSKNKTAFNEAGEAWYIDGSFTDQGQEHDWDLIAEVALWKPIHTIAHLREELSEANEEIEKLKSTSRMSSVCRDLQMKLAESMDALERIANNGIEDVPSTDYAYQLGRMEGIAQVALLKLKGASHE